MSTDCNPLALKLTISKSNTLTHGQYNSNNYSYEFPTPTSPSNNYSYSSTSQHTPSHSLQRPVHSPSQSTTKPVVFTKINGTSTKFAKEFYKKAKVKKVMRGHTCIGKFEAMLMLSHFRNVDVDNIDHTDMALKYLEGKSVKHLKRILRELNDTVRRTFYYGNDFNVMHEQELLKDVENDIKNMHNNHNIDATSTSFSLQPITENIPISISNNHSNSNNNIKKPFITLKDLSNDISIGSLDDYLTSPVPHASYTPSNTTHSPFPSQSYDHKDDNQDDDDKFDDNDVFDPLKGAINMRMKPKPLPFKKNFANKYFKSNTNINDTDKNNDNSNNTAKTMHIDTPFDGNNISWKNNRQSTTKMFGKYFDKRGSNISHGSIWSESSDDDDDNNLSDIDSENDDDPFLLTQMNSDSDDDVDDNQNNQHHLNTSSLSDIPSQKSTQPSKGGKDHFAQYSFASTISLGSDYNPENLSDDDDVHIMSTIKEEEEQLDHNNSNTSTSTNKKQIKYSNKNKNKKHSNNPLKLLRIDSALLQNDDDNGPHHDHQFSLESFLSDMDCPEPTILEKLKYHLTEPRVAPPRRATYNYSHDVKLTKPIKKVINVI